MGWLWGSGKDENSESSNTDPFKDLDPSLREFLQKESPVKYNTSEDPLPGPSTTTPSQSSPAYSEASTQTSGTPNANPAFPGVASKSAYPDGRYAHLWSTYTPLSDIEDASKTDQEKLLDVLNGFKDRKAQIGRAAIENCADEQWAVSECYRSGKITDRLRLCHAENRSFERCYNMQAVRNDSPPVLQYLSSY